MALRRYFNRVSEPRVRQRLAPLVLIGGGLLVWTTTQGRLPRSQDVRVILPAERRAEIRAVRLLYSLEGEGVAGLTRSFPDGAPAELVHAPSLPPGQYELSVSVTAQDGSDSVSEHRLDVPTEGAARIRLPEGDR